MLDVIPAITISGLTLEVLHGSAFIFPCPSRPNLRPALDARALLTTSWLPGTSERYYFQRRSTWLGFSSTSFSLRFRSARCLPIGHSNALNTAAMSADLNLPTVNGDQLNLSGPIGGLQGGVETRGNGDDVRTEIAEVELRNVTLKYGDKMILDGVNLTINRGEAVALIGPSGTGKSTILKLISGLIMPTSGEVIIRGTTRKKNIKQEPPALDAAKIAVVFQNPALFDSLSIAENVAFELLELSDLDDSRISELAMLALERVGLRREVLHLFPPQLSGGMQKRVSFARAVTFDPEETAGVCRAPDLLLLDEPTAGLDPVVSTRMEDLVRELQRVCPTCILVTHCFSTVRRAADRLVFLHDGRIRWDGTVADIDSCQNPYVRQFFNASLDGPMRFMDDHIAEHERAPQVVLETDLFG